jgi:hypothetical protein
MEANTCILTLEERDRLREIEKNVMKGNVVIVQMYNLFSGKITEVKKYINVDDATKAIADEKDSEIEGLLNIIKMLKERPKDTPNNFTISGLKKMSYWQFRKWRKG